MTLTTGRITELVGGRLEGPADLVVSALGVLERADHQTLTFIGDQAHARLWPDSRAVAALVPETLDIEPGHGRALIRVAQVDLAMARMLEQFAPPPVLPEPGVHPAATVHPTAELADDVRIGPGAVVGPNVRIGRGTVLHANATVAEAVTIGADCTVWSGAVIRERCTLGDAVIVHANAVIGGDGFGYRPAPDGRGLVKIPHLGAVRLNDGVEVGAASTIDRGKFEDTVIGADTRIDNLVQIGHNCRIGRSVVISGATGIAGSVEIGDGAQIGGMVAIKDHLTIGDGAILMGAAQVMNHVPAGETWGGSPAREVHVAVRVYAAIERLPGMVKDLRRLKKKNDR